MRRLPLSISSDFGAVHFWIQMCAAASNREKKIREKSYFGGSSLFKVIDVGTPRKLVSSACYDKQQVCVYPQPFSR